MDPGPLSMKSKLYISLTDVFTSEFAVSLNSEHFGAAQGLRFQCTPSLIWNSSSSVQNTAHRLETACVTVNIPIRCLSHATGRNSTDEQKWLKVFPSVGRRRVGKALFRARNRFHITVRQVKVAHFAGEYVYLQFHSLTPYRTCVTGSSSTSPLSVYVVTPTGFNRKQEMMLPVPLSTFKCAVSLNFGPV